MTAVILPTAPPCTSWCEVAEHQALPDRWSDLNAGMAEKRCTVQLLVSEDEEPDLEVSLERFAFFEEANSHVEIGQELVTLLSTEDLPRARVVDLLAALQRARALMHRDPSDGLVTVAEVSAMTRLPEGTLRLWRATQQGPQSFKLGNRVVYLRRDVEAWINAQEADGSTTR